jgi:dephospho-CoA kinase
MEELKLIALTGGIGCGKSTALKIIADAGYKTFSSDSIVGELYQEKEIRKKLKPLFPDAVIGDEFLLDKKKIAAAVFTDKEKHAALTELITPMVIAEIFRRSASLSGKVFVEVPLLFECEFNDMFDGVVVIMRSKSERIKSVMARSNLTEKEVLDRINNQFDYDSADLKNYTVIENESGIEELKTKLLSSIEKM